MANFYAQYASPAQVSIGAQGTNGATAPTVSLEVAGVNPSGNLQPLQTDVSGNLLVSATAPALQNVNLTQVGSSAISEGQKAMAASLPVVIASDQSAVAISAASLPLPSGASTSALQTSGNTSLSTIASNTGNIPTVGQKAMAASTPVTIASDQSAVPVSGTVSITGVATATNQVTGNNSLSSIDGKTPALGQALAAASVPVVLTAAQITTLTPLSSVTVTQATGTNLHTVVDSGTITANAGSGTFATSEIAASSSAVTSVASSASSVSLLASNASRKQATFFNDSTQVLYLKLGATASTSSYTVQIPSNGYYELPNGKIYTGAIDGIWASANGNARITELS